VQFKNEMLWYNSYTVSYAFKNDCVGVTLASFLLMTHDHCPGTSRYTYT